ncbi:MAG: zinc ribbon domain-containing protein, partial [Candidatus Micrarchaeota archaeon]
MKYCTKCGHKLPQPNPKHCPECGAATSGRAAQPTPKRNLALIILGVAILVLGFFAVIGLVSEGTPLTPTPSLAATPAASPAPATESRLLAGATFYKGERPVVKLVTYLSEDDENVTIPAYAGQVLVKAKAGDSRASVDRVLNATGFNYTVLAAIPAIGSYLVDVEEGREADFITALRQGGSGYSAVPNFVLTTQYDTSVVDLSDKAIPETGSAIPALLRSPDPSARAVTIIIDSYARPAASEPSHGE